MQRITLTLVAVLCFAMNYGQDLKVFQLYNKEKDRLTFAEMIAELSDYDVVLFGEYHDNAMIHWLELQTTKALYKEKGKRLLLGAEMFERDNQDALDAYLQKEVDAEALDTIARLWPNFKTDYKPLVDFAQAHNIPFIATNIPRRYAAIVAKNGLDSLEHLPRKERRYIAKMPIKVDMDTPGYSEMLDMMGDHSNGDPMNFVAAQAVKDATMAESIWKQSNRRHLLLHFNGDYHSKEYGGIYWHLTKKKKRWKVAVISFAESDEPHLSIPEDVKPTEFTIVIPSDMTKTF